MAPRFFVVFYRLILAEDGKTIDRHKDICVEKKSGGFLNKKQTLVSIGKHLKPEDDPNDVEIVNILELNNQDYLDWKA